MIFVVISYERIKVVRDFFNVRFIVLSCVLKKVVILWVISFVVNVLVLYVYGIVKDKIRDKIVCNSKLFGELVR